MTIQDLPRHIDLKMTMILRLRSGQVYTHIVNRPDDVGNTILCTVVRDKIPLSYITSNVGCA